MRLEVMGRDGFACKHCGDKTTTLNVHHEYYERGRDPWDYPMSALETVCEPCHKAEHGIVTEKRSGPPLSPFAVMARCVLEATSLSVHVEIPAPYLGKEATALGALLNFLRSLPVHFKLSLRSDQILLAFRDDGDVRKLVEAFPLPVDWSGADIEAAFWHASRSIQKTAKVYGKRLPDIEGPGERALRIARQAVAQRRSA